MTWPACLRNCKRVPHPLRETKPFLRDRILDKESGRHIGNIQNNLAVGVFKDKNVALFRASDTVIDCGNGVIIDFPTWKDLRDMLGTQKPQVLITVQMLMKLAGQAEEEVAEGNAEEIMAKEEEEWQPPESAKRKAFTSGPRGERQAKRARFVKQEVDPVAWLREELAEYPTTIHLVSSESSEAYQSLVEEAATASLVAYDAQWTPDFDGGTDNPVALLQLAFPWTGNTYVLQLPLLDGGCPAEVRRLFESAKVKAVGYASEIDMHKLQITGINVDRSTLIDLQPWSEAEMGENESVKQGWRVGLKRAAWSVLDFELDKSAVVATSNWEREELTPTQVEYAALVVWVA
eukprot:CAMPEP_0178426594 /NCGR_PEP_ID=MMETSP0689_2-20121128/29313_1 /TAXON_ID=160604 /ORGANISM="Amphidinium massartii, Strain CS-259" /LENGTH=347 /DNA_ID=CAMNT_0020048281 /DNA_START=107 /DNA_END=1146 /DNA_ORIENTATION=+